MRDMDQYMCALDIIARVNHIDDYCEEQRLKVIEDNNTMGLVPPGTLHALQQQESADGSGNDDLE